MNIDDPRVNENFAELSAALAETRDSALIEGFLRCLLTPAETADIAGRWALVKALKQKKTQREIAKDLGVSLCKSPAVRASLKSPALLLSGSSPRGIKRRGQPRRSCHERTVHPAG